MTQLLIKEVFTKSYNQAIWKQFLGEIFNNTKLFIKPETLTNIDINVASNAQKLGYILLYENGIERQIGVYDVTLAQGVILEQNRLILRNLLRKYWQNIDGAFIVYYPPKNTNWYFTYVSELTDYETQGDFIHIKTEPKYYTYLFGKGEKIKTAVDRFETIIKKGKNLTLDNIKEAFSVEKLSKTFFDQYKKQYDLFCQYMVSQKGIFQRIFNGDEKAIRDFNKKLLGRIIFLYFIQKKGWLGVQKNQIWGEGDQNFLTNQFNNYPHKEFFYQDFLAVLFFDTLNIKRKDDLIELIKNNPCRIPYLNGGLFEEDDKIQRNLIFPTDLFENLFNFFNQYNFTIYEDDLNDYTVAVNPEMLSHIFENLLEDNKDKGAYYTPKEIVYYMCQESLIEYLITYCLNFNFSDLNITLTKENQKDLITQFIKKKEINLTLFKESKELKELWFRELNKALDTVKICDPAIGSGAFPMGLLQEIFTAKQTLFLFKYGNTNNFKRAEVKLNIIQNSIYGIDIEKGAVDMAKLRFWLSLIGDKFEPKPLSNLDYKIVVGNSLVSKLEDEIIEINWKIKGYKQTNIFDNILKSEEILSEINEKQKIFFRLDRNKKNLAREIRNLKIDFLITQLELMVKSKGMKNKPTSIGKKLTNETKIYLQTMAWKNKIILLNKLKTKPDLSLNFFDWKLDFPEVMNEQIVENVGFDIVIGNPPYGANLGDLELKYFKENYQVKTSETAILFMEKGLTLTKKNGIKTYIIPKSFTFASNYSKIRDFVYKEIALIADCGKAFENVKFEVCIISLRKGQILETYQSILFKTDKSFDFIGYINKELTSRFGFFLNGINEFELKIGNKIFERSNWLNNIANNSRGEILQKHLIKNGKYAVIGGKEINKYGIRGIKGFINDLNLISKKAKINHNSVLVQNIIAHLKKPYEQIQIISCIPNTNEIILTDTINQITINDNGIISAKYIWCLLNSKLINWYVYLFIFGKAIRTMHFDNIVTSRIPIPSISQPIQNLFIKQADQIIKLQSEGKNTTILEQQIDNLLYKIYELSYQEVKIIDPQFTLTKQEYDRFVVGL